MIQVSLFSHDLDPVVFSKFSSLTSIKFPDIFVFLMLNLVLFCYGTVVCNIEIFFNFLRVGFIAQNMVNLGKRFCALEILCMLMLLGEMVSKIN